MEESSPMFQLYGYGLCKGVSPIPKIAGYKAQDSSIWMVPEMFGDITWVVPIWAMKKRAPGYLLYRGDEVLPSYIGIIS